MKKVMLVCAWAGVTVSVSLAYGFSEDSTSPTGASKSSGHYDITLTFGRCLGVSPTDRQTIADADESTDTGCFNATCVDFTSRGGANGAYFHASQLVAGVDALAELKTWSAPSSLGSSYAPLNVPVVTEQMKSLAGTTTAFGVYLHALADKYSHLACTDAGFVPHCGGPAFPPCTGSTERNFCHYRDAHNDEFGVDPVLTANTIAGLQAVYVAMSQRYGKGASIPPSVATFITQFANTRRAADRVTLANATCP